jgi:hypothetical protein
VNLKIKHFLIHVFAPLIIGSLLYISFRSETIRMFSWFETVGLSSFVNGIRKILNPFKENIPTWIYYSLPDGLWVYSFTSSYMLIWGKDIQSAKYWLLLPLVFGSAVELAQGIRIFPGTFDILDFLCCSVGLLLSILIFKLNKNEKKIF